MLGQIAHVNITVPVRIKQFAQQTHGLRLALFHGIPFLSKVSGKRTWIHLFLSRRLPERSHYNRREHTHKFADRSRIKTA
jgi:hypothetical protein